MIRTISLFCRMLVPQWLVLFLSACGYCPAAPDTKVKVSPITPSIQLCRDEAREVLKKHCGRCHLGSISEKPAALKVYNLEDDIWYRNLDPKNYKGISRRISNWDGPTRKEIETVLACVACLKDETCR